MLRMHLQVAAKVIGQLLDREDNNREDAGVNVSGIERVMAALSHETLNLRNASNTL